MFKKFNPKEDIATSVLLKSSVQRTIRQKLIAQYALLSVPAVPAPKTDDAAVDSDSDAEELAARPVGAGKKARGKKEDKRGGKAKGGKKGAKAEEEVEEVKEETGTAGAGAEDELTVLDVLWPKKEGLTLVKCREALSILVLHGEPLFFQHFDGPYFPTLRILHKYPDLLPRVGVDRGAIKFVLSGANIMCPGMTSATGYLPQTNIPSQTPVAVYAAGKDLPLGIGLTLMSTDDIRSINKNIGVENMTYLGDDLWSHNKL